jgi:hypothetical protein
MIRPRISARAAAALLGIRIAGGQERQQRSTVIDPEPPLRRPELDRQELDDELSLALHAELGELLEARAYGGRPPMAIGRADSARPRCGRRRRGVHNDLGRRGQCPTTRR